MDLFNRIKSRREELGMTQGELAEKLGYSDRSSIAKIESGVNDIVQSKIAAFAEALNTTPSYLMGWTNDPYDYESDPDSRASEIPIDMFKNLHEIYGGDLKRIWNAYLAIDNDAAYDVNKTLLPPNILPMPELKRVPRLGAIACGVPTLAEENMEGHDVVPSYVQADFTLICKGDSMINARIFDGDIVCIHKQSMVDSGEIAAVVIDNDATLKRVKLYDDHIVLAPENPLYKPLSYWDDDMNDVHIVGKATHFISAIR